MRYFTYQEKESYKLAILVQKIDVTAIEREYINKLSLDKNEVLILELYQEPGKKKTSTAVRKEYLKEVNEVLTELNVEYVLVADPDYFKLMTHTAKAEVNLGYIFNIETLKIGYVPSTKSIFYDPEKTRVKIGKTLTAFNDDFLGQYKEPGKSIIKEASYPEQPSDIVKQLRIAFSKPALTCDIETFSLHAHKAGLASITFCFDEGRGIAFSIDPSPTDRNTMVRRILKDFFEHYEGKLIFHNIAFDATVLIYQLWMRDITDTAGLLEGLNVLLRNFEDTKLIAYLCTNSCSGNELGLKALSQEFAGNYAQEEIGDVTQIPQQQLLEYNLTDGLATWFVYNKYKPMLKMEEQEEIYETLFKPATKDIIQMQLTGFPMNMKRVLEVEAQLQGDLNKALETIKHSPLVDEFTALLNQKWVENKNKKLKKKKVSLLDAHEEFNPRSNLQLREFLYEFLELPVLAKTDSGLASTDGSTMESLLHHTENQEVKNVLQAFLDYSAVDKILTAFIPAFKNAVPGSDGWHYLIGNFNLGGTVSGRLSSNNPNLQNLPATGSKYAKTIKSCFQAPPGWIMCGLDFAALEDHISALTTKDPEKLKVYTDGYDGHCLRAYSYYKEYMKDVTEDLRKEPEKEVQIINSIKDRYKKYRQASKGCTFALTYGGTYRTLMTNLGFNEPDARRIEKAYHELYTVSDNWVKNKMVQASKDGYVKVAFGLKVRTPVLKQCVLGTKVTPKEAEAEKRTAGNALGQSYGLLNSRAGVEFNSLVRESEYKHMIRPCAQIHDAQYFLIKDDVDCLLYANEHLVKAVSWQEEPGIKHDKVHLGGEFSIFWPDWAHELVIPNVITKPELEKLTEDYARNLQ